MADEGQTIADEGALYEVAYDEAARALSEQLSLIDSFRTRAGLLLSAAAITTSVLGSQALDRGPIGCPAWAALASFFAVAILSLAILWPRRRGFAADSAEIVKSCIESDSPRSIIDLRWALTAQMHQSYAANWIDLGQMATLFEIASSLLVIEILFWIVTFGASV
jgi:hypothetical protein